jgi:hypothetical protein
MRLPRSGVSHYPLRITHYQVKSFTAKDTKDAKERKSFTAKDAKE